MRLAIETEVKSPVGLGLEMNEKLDHENREEE